MYVFDLQRVRLFCQVRLQTGSDLPSSVLVDVLEHWIPIPHHQAPFRISVAYVFTYHPFSVRLLSHAVNRRGFGEHDWTNRRHWSRHDVDAVRIWLRELPIQLLETVSTVSACSCRVDLFVL
jgi:hypothetical protein